MENLDMKKFMLLLALPLTALADLDPLVGEWSISTTEEAGDCSELRMAFNIDGHYTLQMAEDGRWKLLDGGRWNRKGGLIITETAGHSERFALEIETNKRIILVSQDDAVDRKLGVGYLDLARCPTN